MGIVAVYRYPELKATVTIRDDYATKDPVRRQQILDSVWCIVNEAQRRVAREAEEKQKSAGLTDKEKGVQTDDE